MGDSKHLIEKFEADFHKIASKEGWEPCDITLMKDLEKLMYYIEVRDAMKGTDEYPGSEYMDDMRSYARGRNRNAMGQFTSGGMGYGNYYDGRSMHNMPMNDGPWGYDNRYYDQGSGRRYYDDNMRGSGRRYYDGEKDTSVAYLRRMMDSETRPEMKTAMQNVIKELEMR